MLLKFLYDCKLLTFCLYLLLTNKQSKNLGTFLIKTNQSPFEEPHKTKHWFLGSHVFDNITQPQIVMMRAKSVINKPENISCAIVYKVIWLEATSA